MDQIETLYDQLRGDPSNWALRTQLIGLLARQGDMGNAHKVLSEAPAASDLHQEPVVEFDPNEVVAAQTAAYDLTALPPLVPTPEQSGEGSIEPIVPGTGLQRMSPDQIQRPEPLVDPDSVPASRRIYVAASVPSGETRLNYVHSEQLSETRKHLAVYADDGAAMDADQLSSQPDECEDGGGLSHHDPVIFVAEGGYVPRAAEADGTSEKVGAVLTTILAHVAIALIMWMVVIAIPKPKPPEIVATIAPSNTENKVTKRTLARAVNKTPSAPSNQSVAVITAATTSNVSAPVIDFTDPNQTVEVGTSFGAGLGFGGAGNGFGRGFSVPNAMKSRCSHAERARMRRDFGGNQLGDTKIKAALKYLASIQNKDGSWGTKYKGGMTGFALLCYLGYCVTPDHTEYGETVMKGIMYLVEFNNRNQRIYATSDTHGKSYEHGIATYALGEVYAIARLGQRKLPGMKEAFEEGVEIIIKGQNPDGGWSYGYPGRGASDTSVTGWQYQALKAAKHTRLSIPRLSGAISKAQDYLDDIQDRNNGMFPYRPGGAGSPSLVGAGVLGLQMLGGFGYRDEIEKGLEAIVARIKGKNWANANLYEWYYNTQACFEAGGESWKKWNAMFQDQVVNNQRPNGSWTNALCGKHAQADGDIYATCLCTLMLEVYYRYLPASSSR